MGNYYNNDMTGLERTLAFLAGQPVDRTPFHPIVMRWAARYAGIKYRDFCLDYRAKAAVMIKCADDFDMDWVTVIAHHCWGRGRSFPARPIPSVSSRTARPPKFRQVCMKAAFRLAAASSSRPGAKFRRTRRCKI